MVRTHDPVLGQGASVGDYEIIIKCGAGTYGSVYKAIHKTTRRVVALKKVAKFPLEDGCPVECKYLEQLFPSRNIVNMLEYFYTLEGQLVLIFEYMEMDLWKLISGPNSNVPVLQMKCIMKQLFEGLHQCHTAGIMHRDVKPSNLLLNAAGVLKLADFGLTTSFVRPPYLSNNVVSLYYRPPELLMGSHDYGPEIDIWSAGCILVELLTNDYLFAGSNESDQLNMIFKVFGTPNESVWPGVSMLPGWGLVESARQHPTRDLMANYAYLDASALDLASRLLQLDPKKRITSIEALSHPWFSANPLPCLPSLLPNLWKDRKVPPPKSRALEASNFNRGLNNNISFNTTFNSNILNNNANVDTSSTNTSNISTNENNTTMPDNNCIYNYSNYNYNMNYYNMMSEFYNNNYNFYNNFYANNYNQNNINMYNYYMSMNINYNTNMQNCFNNGQYYVSNLPTCNMYYNNQSYINSYNNNYNNFNNYNHAEHDNRNTFGPANGPDKVNSRQRQVHRNGFEPRPRYNYAQ